MADTDTDNSLKIVIATFADPNRAPRALASISPALSSAISMAACVARTEDGKVRFVETHDRTAAEGAVKGMGWGAIGGVLGLALGPVALLGAPIGAGIGALIAKLRDTGFDDDGLKDLGEDLAPGSGALVVAVEADDVAQASRMLLGELGAGRVVVKHVGADLATVLDEIAGPLPPPTLDSAADA